MYAFYVCCWWMLLCVSEGKREGGRREFGLSWNRIIAYPRYNLMDRARTAE